ncbi:MAG: hypothetical protein AABW92_02820 [Nanoarchaeota archaeon]
MVSITLAVPEDLKNAMDLFPEMNWSAVAREAIKKKVLMMGKFKEFTKDSELTEVNALNFGKEVSMKAMKRHKA